MLEKHFEKEKTCRTCTKTGIELSSLFTKLDAPDGVCFSQMITECIMYTVQEDDDLPHLICSECAEKVRIAYNFKKQCEESHRRLLTMIESMKEAAMAMDKVCNSSSEEGRKDEDTEGNNNLRKKSTRKIPTKWHPCEKCREVFADLEELKNHVKAKHKAPRHNCPICLKEFIRLGHLARHMNKIHKKETTPEENTKEEVFVKTESEFVNEQVLEEQTNVGNSSKVRSETEDMNFDFESDNEYEPSYHEDSRSVKSVKAELENSDGKASVENVHAISDKKGEEEETKEAISDEKKEEKEEEETKETITKAVETNKTKKIKSPSRAFEDSNRRFQCDQCHKAFKRKSHLKQHSLCHTKIKPYQCTICQKKFGRPDNLKVHMSNHGQKHFQCNSCDRSFGQAYLLKRHKDQTHSEEKPFLCSECGQRFVRNGDLAVHMRRHTGEKPYKCQYCSKGFTRSTEVYVHERYHTGEKRHVCSICGKAFQRPYNLLVHVRTHTGERPYQCPHCPKNFAQCSDLKAHIRRHTGERYRCDQCGMGFIHVFVLNQHKLSVHGIEVQSRIKRIVKLSTDTQ